LTPDGVIFISIDDNEVHNLRRLCNEVFGEENFVGNITVLCNPKGRSQDKYFATNHENVIVYSKSLLPKGSFSIGKDEEQVANEYPEEDELGKYRLLELRNTHREFGKHNRKNLYYPLYINKETGEVSLNKNGESIKVEPIWDDGFEGCWTWDKNKVQSDNAYLVGVKNKKVKWKVYRKSYASGADKMCKTIFLDKSFYTEKGQKEFNKIFEVKSKLFQSPKSVELIKLLIKTSSSDGSLILDFFAGSGSTGQAVMELNEEDGGNRKFILVQLPELTDEKSEAYKAGYKKISDITIERNKRVVERLVAAKKQAHPNLFENADESGALKGLGFKVFRLEKSYFPRADWSPDPSLTEEENIRTLKLYIADKEAQLNLSFDRDKLLTEILLKEEGFKLNYTASPYEAVTANEILRVTDGDKEALICLDPTLEEKTVKHFKTHHELKFICLERALDTTRKWNLHHFLGEKFKAF
jgi:adenine-specific DNA-methyltransferase